MANLVSNASANLILKLTRLVLVFIITPVLINNLGFYDYGIWEVVISLIGYVGILNLGLPSSLVKFISQSHAENDIGYAQILFRKSMKYMLLVSLVAAFILFVFNILYFELFPKEFLTYQDKYQTFLTLISVFIILSFISTVITSTVEGFQLFALKTKVIVPIAIGINCYIWFNINPDNALLLLISTSLVSSVITSTVLCVFLQYRFKILWGSAASKRSFDLKEVVRFSFKSFVQGTMYKIQDTVAPILVSTTLGPAMVVFFIVPKNLIGHKRDIEMTITQVFLPYFSYKNVDNQNSTSDYYQFSLILMLITLPISLGILFLGSDFLRLWVGDEIAMKGELIIQLLAISSIAGSIDPLGSKYLTSLGKHGIYAKLAPIQLIVFLVTATFLLNTLGVNGIAWAVLLNSIIFPAIYFRYRCLVQGDSMKQYILAVFSKLVVPSLLFATTVMTIQHFVIIDNYFSFLAAAAAPTVVFLLYVLLFVCSDSQRQQVISYLKR